jgi:hypothetical protein
MPIFERAHQPFATNIFIQPCDGYPRPQFIQQNICTLHMRQMRAQLDITACTARRAKYENKKDKSLVVNSVTCCALSKRKYVIRKAGATRSAGN